MNSLRYSCYLLTIDQVSTDHLPSVDQSLTDTSVKYRRTIGEVSAKIRRSVGEVSVKEKLYRPTHIWNDHRPCLDRVSSDYRPSLDRLSTAISTLRRLSGPEFTLSTDFRICADVSIFETGFGRFRTVFIYFADICTFWT